MIHLRYNRFNFKLIYRNFSKQQASDLIDFPVLIENLKKSMGVTGGYSKVPKHRDELIKFAPKSPDQLPKRQMKDSFIAARIPLSRDIRIQDRYITVMENVRIGRLLEDMDIFAVAVAERHILIPDKPPDIPNPYVLVTASLDRIDFTDYVAKPTIDIKISGHVCYVGKSSMDIFVWLEQEIDGSYHRITQANFVFVARDPTNTKSVPVNPIDPKDDKHEQNLLVEGELRRKQRSELAKHHTSKVLPNQDELQILHGLYLATKGKENLMESVLPENCVWMENCRLSNTIITHPEHRNMHNRVFGGYIMRKTLELSFMCAYLFAKTRPHIRTISDIVFRQPISVNSFIRMYAYVVYTHEKFVQIELHVNVIDTGTGKLSTTNIFKFIYECPEIVRQVVPRTYQETMMYIEGKRTFKKIIGSREDKKPARKPC